MNTLLCSLKRPIKFLGRINEDNTTQKNKGGMTDIYLDTGTYLKSFYSVMFCPSCVKISKMGNKDMRIHHKIKWENAVPCILNEKYKVQRIQQK